MQGQKVAIRGSLRCRLSLLNASKDFYIAHVVLFAHFRGALAHPFLHIGIVGMLAYVRRQGRQFLLNGRRDIYSAIRIRRAHKIDLFDAMRAQALLKQFREGPGILRRRVNGSYRRLPGSQVVGMIAPDKHSRIPGAIRRLDDDALRAILANETHKVAPQFNRWLQRAIGIAQKEDIFDAKHVRGLSLLAHARLRNLAPRLQANIRRIIRPALRGVGNDDIVNIPTFFGPFRNRAGRAKFGIVGMRKNNHRYLLLLLRLLAHKYIFLTSKKLTHPKDVQKRYVENSSATHIPSTIYPVKCPSWMCHAERRRAASPRATAPLTVECPPWTCHASLSLSI